MTLEVKFDPGFGIYGLDYICFHVSQVCKSHYSQAEIRSIQLKKINKFLGANFKLVQLNLTFLDK